jgi:hypothetical protein
VRGHLALARIGDSLPLEVPIDAAALHEIAPGSAHRADDAFPASEGGSRVRTRPFYENLERWGLEVGAVGRGVC